MSKNMTRKGLALGATLALATTGLVATPAFANSVVTSLASGTSFNSVVGYDNELRLSTVMSPGLAGNETTLHYRVSNPSGAALEIGVGRSGQDTGAIALATAAATSNTAGIWGYQNAAAAYSTVDADAADGDFQTALTDFVVVPTGNRQGEADDANFITIAVQDVTAVQNVTVTVTAWLDTAANASNVQDPVEVTGNTITLNFFDPANVAATTTMVAPVTGANSVSAEITTNPELNGEQLGTNFLSVDFTAQGNGNAVLAQNTLDSNGQTAGSTTYNGTTKRWTSTAFLNYSVGSDRWNGTNATVADVNLATTINSGTWFYHNSNSVSGPTVLFTSTNSQFANAVTHGLTAATGVTHFVVFGTGVTNANVAPLAAASVSFGTTSITLTDAKTASAGVANSAGTAITQGTLRSLVAGTNATVQASGVYSARPFIGTTALGAATPSTTSAITADDTEVSVVGTANISEAFDDNAASYNGGSGQADRVLVRPGTTSVTVTAQIYYTDTLDLSKVKKAPAGVPVVGTIAVGSGTFQVNAAGAGVLSSTVQTDANGVATFTVTTTTAVNGSNVSIDIRPQSVALANAAGAKLNLVWETAAFTLYDLNTVQDQPSGSNETSFRHINTGGRYTFAFALLDQWGQPAPSDTWRLQVVNSGRTVSSDTHNLTNGRVEVSVADGAQGSTSSIITTVNIQRLSAGTWSTETTPSWDGSGIGTVQINVAASGSETITLDANGGVLYQSSYASATADLDVTVASEQTVAQNRRLSAALQPAYAAAGKAVINGRVTVATTGLAKGGTNVTITGDSSILFSYGKVDSFGSIVVPADAAGDFTVNMYSNKAFDDTVITLTTANGASRTVKVDFGPATATSGRTLTYTSTGGEPGRTLIITGLLTDKWGNPVDTDQIATQPAGASVLDSGDARLTVTYTGPGLISGSMPVETGTDGTFVVRVLLGVNDTGTATVSATYGAANGTISATDTGTGIDIRGSVTVTIGKAATAPSAGKVNVGSFNGKLVVYAANLNGARISWKVGGNWGTGVASSNYSIFNRPTPRAGATVSVDIYVNGVKTLTKSVVTR